MSWLALLKVIAPIIIQARVKHGDLLAPIIVSAMEHAEGLAHAKGMQKLAYVKAAAIDAANAINTQVPGKINVDSLSNTIEAGVSAAVTATNIVEKNMTPVATPKSDKK